MLQISAVSENASGQMVKSTAMITSSDITLSGNEPATADTINANICPLISGTSTISTSSSNAIYEAIPIGPSNRLPNGNATSASADIGPPNASTAFADQNGSTNVNTEYGDLDSGGHVESDLDINGDKSPIHDEGQNDESNIRLQVSNIEMETQ